MAIRLLVCDVDGTLVDSRNRISKRNKEAIDRLFASGVSFALCSGRSLSDLEELEKELKLKERGGYLIAANGNALYDCKTGKLETENELDFSLVKKVYEVIKHKGLLIRVEGLREAYESVPILLRPMLALYRKMKKNPFRALDFSKCLKSATIPMNINKLIVIRPFAPNHLKKKLEDLYGESLQVLPVGTHTLEIVSKKSDKLSGVKKLIEKRNISLSEVMAIGDAENDLGILKETGLGVALSNAPLSVQSAAKAVADNRKAEGVAEAIETYVLGG